MLRREHRHDARQEKKKKHYGNGRTGGSKKTTLTVSQRPAPADSAPSRSPARHTLRGARPPSREGDGRALTLYPARLPRGSPPPPAHRRQRRPGGGARGERGNDTTSSASGTCRTSRSAPGAPTPRAKAKRRPHAQRGGACGATTGQTPSPPRGRAPATNASPERRAESVRCVTKTTGRDTEVGPGSAPLPFHAPPPGGEERRGARGQSEKSGPIRQGMSVPRLARLRPGPGERDVTTSIHRQQKRGADKKGNEARTTVRNASLRFSLATYALRLSPSPRGGGKEARSAGTGARDVQQPARAGPRRTAFARAARTGAGKPGFGSRPRSSRGHPPSSNHPRTVCPQASRGTKCQL